MSKDDKCPGAWTARGLDPLDASVVESFRRAAHLNRQMFTHIVGFEKPGHPGRAIMLLVLGSAADGMTQRQIGDILRVSAPTVTVMLQKLEAHGLIERWTDEEDQRLTRIRMTAKGREVSERFSAKYNEFVDATIGQMSADDRREFARLLGIFSDNMQKAMERETER